MIDGRFQLVAPCIFGLEAIVARELKELGYNDHSVENGRVTFTGDAEAICRANIQLRCAERLLVKIGDFNAMTFDELFENTKSLPWVDWLPEDAEFPVEVNSINSKLASLPDCQSIVKKAVVESLKKSYKRSWFEETGPRYKIIVMILKDWVTVSIDTSGVGLHKRGYRKLVGEAPLKETLAAALLLISRWNKDRVLIDPFCGSGTIPIEAALIGKNIAPGKDRTFAAEMWNNLDTALWKQARQEAEDTILRDQKLRITGSDIDKDAISLARFHARKAGIFDDIHLQCMPMSEISSRYKYGFIICNPPYGERIGEIKEVEELYGQMGEKFQEFDTWSFYILSSHMNYERLFGKKANKKRKLYNGKILCNYYQFFGPPPPRGGERIV